MGRVGVNGRAERVSWGAQHGALGWGLGNGACWGERQGRAGELGGTARCNVVGLGGGGE